MTSTPTKSVRLSVPVSLEVQATFQRLAEASGKSMAASLSQWLVDTQQAAELMADNIEQLRSSPGDAVTRVRLHTAALEDLADQAIEDAMNRAERLADQDEWPIARARGTEPADGRGRGRSAPPSSNTGGKGTKTGGGKPGVKPASGRSK